VLHIDVEAVVSRGGRPDSVPVDTMRTISTPTLLIVGERDEWVLQQTRQIFLAMPGASSPSVDQRIEIIPGATHLFEEVYY
jgi:putative phosphoribosyl transferase